MWKNLNSLWDTSTHEYGGAFKTNIMQYRYNTVNDIANHYDWQLANAYMYGVDG